MSSTDTQLVRNPKPGELLRYLPNYQVVVCTTCSYAIQPNAIARHLKEIHFIQGSARKPYMHHVSKLQLADPDHVLRLTPKDFPVPLLPVHDGFKCTSETCGHLCITEKRMKAHWTSTHGRQGQLDADFKHALLQTFFKGNLLHYFTGSPALPVEKVLVGGEMAMFRNPGRVEETRDIYQLTETISSVAVTPYDWSKQLDTSDLFLLEHYYQSTYISIATAEDTIEMWKTTVPLIAQHHLFVMHAILACSALHLAHLTPSLRPSLLISARAHLAISMPLFRTAIAHVTTTNCNAILIFTHLLVVCSFASCEADEDLFSNPNPSEDLLPCWLFFLRSGCSMLGAVWNQIATGPVRPLAAAWEIPIDITAFTYEPILDYFLSIPQDEWPLSERETYTEAAGELARAFSCMDALESRITTWDAIRIWPMRKSYQYIVLLRAWHPGALILLAHYCLILDRLEEYWYFKGRAQRLLLTIENRLDERWHRYIEWPLTRVQPNFRGATTVAAFSSS